MAVTKIDIHEFLELAKHYPVVDVRSPGEYGHAHIPRAHSLPLFTDEERKIVGTTYKQQSRECAIKEGLDFFGVKMRDIVEQVEQLNEKNNSKTILVHCWRGGMRSAAIAWLLDLYGFRVYTLAGGYKAYRNWALQQFEKEYPFIILGGYTGSGKTHVLDRLQKNGEIIIDLEDIAKHKGSAFGDLEGVSQPKPEMFENILALQLFEATKFNTSIWLEDESQRIGLINLPNHFWKTMRSSPVMFIDIPFEERLQHLVLEYGSIDKAKMINAIIRIRKRLGGLETKTAINFLLEDNTTEAFRVLLRYYDKHYTKALHNRENLHSKLQTISCDTVDPDKNSQKLIAEKLTTKHGHTTPGC
jgi:tRNA 2-selenouridine synthase